MERWSDLSPERQAYLRARAADREYVNELFRLELAEREFKWTPETHRIVATKPDGGVSVTLPTHEALYYMTGPGGYWSDRRPGFLRELVRIKTCPILQQGHPCTERAARKFVNAMQWGGKSCEEAWDILAEHDVARFGGTAIEVMHVSELPRDRKFRDFWRRSKNGGPIYVFDAPAAAYNNIVREAA
jgi:hypothetical protein